MTYQQGECDCCGGAHLTGTCHPIDVGRLQRAWERYSTCRRKKPCKQHAEMAAALAALYDKDE